MKIKNLYCQKTYVEMLLRKFSMKKIEQINTPLANHFKFSLKQSPSSEKEKY